MENQHCTQCGDGSQLCFVGVIQPNSESLSSESKSAGSGVDSVSAACGADLGLGPAKILVKCYLCS